jgi:hypothetical protein
MFLGGRDDLDLVPHGLSGFREVGLDPFLALSDGGLPSPHLELIGPQTVALLPKALGQRSRSIGTVAQIGTRHTIDNEGHQRAGRHMTSYPIMMRNRLARALIEIARV